MIFNSTLSIWNTTSTAFQRNRKKNPHTNPNTRKFYFVRCSLLTALSEITFHWDDPICNFNPIFPTFPALVCTVSSIVLVFCVCVGVCNRTSVWSITINQRTSKTSIQYWEISRAFVARSPTNWLVWTWPYPTYWYYHNNGIYSKRRQPVEPTFFRSYIDGCSTLASHSISLFFCSTLFNHTNEFNSAVLSNMFNSLCVPSILIICPTRETAYYYHFVCGAMGVRVGL